MSWITKFPTEKITHKGMVYGTPNLWWVIAMANDIMDPEEELIPGALIKVPTIV